MSRNQGFVALIIVRCGKSKNLLDCRNYLIIEDYVRERKKCQKLNFTHFFVFSCNERYIFCCLCYRLVKHHLLDPNEQVDVWLT